MTPNSEGLDPEPTIVVGVDGSDHSRFALKWAADEAKKHGYLLRILYGRIDEPKHVPAWYEAGSCDLSPEQAVIDDAYGLVGTRHPSVRAQREIVEWPPAMALTAASRSARLLVLGARGMGGFEESFSGRSAISASTTRTLLSPSFMAIPTHYRCRQLSAESWLASMARRGQGLR